MYSIDNCSWYNIKRNQAPDVYIFEEHQRAFPVWGTYANREHRPLTLITFDSHCDTLPGSVYASNGDLEWQELKDSLKIERNEFTFEDAFRATCEIVNDKHIKFAYFCGYINRAFIFTRAEEDPYRLQVNFENYDRSHGFDFTYRYVDGYEVDLNVLDGIEGNFILDIDLDFFIKPFDFHEGIGDQMRLLVKEAKVITVATEPEFFEYCRVDESFTNDNALDALMKVIQEERK